MISATGKCIAACRGAVLRWARRGKICPLYQEGGARDVRSSSDASRGCSLASLETHCGRPQESGLSQSCGRRWMSRLKLDTSRSGLPEAHDGGGGPAVTGGVEACPGRDQVSQRCAG